MSNIHRLAGLIEMTQALRLGIAGLGTVGGGVLDILTRHKDLVAVRAGRPVEVVAVSARSKGKDRGHDLSKITLVLFQRKVDGSASIYFLGDGFVADKRYRNPVLRTIGIVQDIVSCDVCLCTFNNPVVSIKLRDRNPLDWLSGLVCNLSAQNSLCGYQHPCKCQHQCKC